MSDNPYVHTGRMRNIISKILRREHGFTITEITAAMMVAGVLSGVAVPTYLGMRDDAYDFEAQSAVNTALTVAQLHYATTGDFSAQHGACGGTTSLTDDLRSLEPKFEFVTSETPSTGPLVVSVQSKKTYNANKESLGCQAFYAATLSQAGNCWVGRLAVEGAYVSADPAAIEFVSISTNGNAYSGVKATSTTSLAAVQSMCSAAAQADVAIGETASEFFPSWNTVQLP